MQKKYPSIRDEVLDYLDIGIKVTLNGRDIYSCDRGISSIKENTCYMKDYIRDEKGNLETINFTQIKKF